MPGSGARTRPAVLAAAVANPNESVLYGPSPLLIGALSTGVLGALLWVGVLACAVLAYRRRWWGPLGRAHYALVAAAGLVLLGVARFYNLVGFHF